MKSIIEVHNGLSALIADKSKYDGLWISSLTHSASKGLPDTELIPLSERVDLVREIRRVSNKPIYVDVDTGGGHIGYHAKWLADAGAYALIIEDKAFPKQNSLLKDKKHNLEDIDKFCDKIKEARKSGIMIIARIESLIAKHSMYEALIRAEAYIQAGANGIMIHSKQQVDCSEVMEFAKKFRESWTLPLIAVPTTYQLPLEHPFDIVIHANHLLRASIKGMQDYLKGGEVVPIEDIFNLIGNDRSTNNRT
jgi:2-methylisocitrate lyase-like PEP mutase family enzyme